MTENKADQARLAPLRAGGKLAMAHALARIEAKAGHPETVALLDAAYRDAKGHVLGITGPPGVGKSSLIATLINAYRSRDETVGVIAIDPSSSRTRGALLGDRARIETDPRDQGIFIRSMAARDRIGGLASITTAAMVLMRSVYDRVIIETVGVGQSETDIATLADSVLLCVQPGSGDSLQYLKAGIAEIPDITLVTKADLGQVAKQTRQDLASALTTAGQTTGREEDAAWQVPVLQISVLAAEGAADLLGAIDRHQAHLKVSGIGERRHLQTRHWIRQGLQEAYGREGLRYLNGLESDEASAARLPQSPFLQLHRQFGLLRDKLSGAG